MSQSIYLLSSVSGDSSTPFDEARIKQVLESIEGVKEWDGQPYERDAIDRVFSYTLAEDRQLVAMTVFCTLGCVSLTETTDAAFSLAMRIQRLYGEELFFVIGDNYAAAIPLSTVATVSELHSRLGY
jgi:hypothetical protein